jgi:hypothetical protein
MAPSSCATTPPGRVSPKANGCTGWPLVNSCIPDSWACTVAANSVTTSLAWR